MLPLSETNSTATSGASMKVLISLAIVSFIALCSIGANFYFIANKGNETSSKVEVNNLKGEKAKLETTLGTLTKENEELKKKVAKENSTLSKEEDVILSEENDPLIEENDTLIKENTTPLTKKNEPKKEVLKENEEPKKEVTKENEEPKKEVTKENEEPKKEVTSENATKKNEELKKENATKENEELKKDVPAHQASLPFRDEYKEYEPLLKSALELEVNPTDPKAVDIYAEQITKIVPKNYTKFCKWLQLSDPNYNDPTQFVRFLSIMSVGTNNRDLKTDITKYAADIKKSPKDFLTAHLYDLNRVLECFSGSSWRLTL
jgi:hypothetical protein